MKIFYEVLKCCPLFSDIAEKNLSTLLTCLSAVQKSFGKGSVIFSADDHVAHVGVVLEGSVHIIQNDYWGNRMILARIEPSGLFGEVFSCAGIEKLPVSVA
jgi:CRP-like cAMP-binding protein